MTALDWPAGWDRTPVSEREPNRDFQASLGSTTEDLATEMDRMDVDSWRASFGNQHAKQNSLPRYNAKPDDPGFVLRWVDGEERYAVACDAYSRLRDNIRSVYLWVHETRLRAQRPVQTGDAEFAAARLPSGDSEEDVVVAREPPHEVLGVEPDASDAEVQDAFREALKDAHPDAGGSREEFDRVTEARDALLGGDER